MAFAVKITHNATPASDYEMVYRIVKKNGARVSNGAWVREADSNPTIPGLTSHAGYAIFDGEDIGNTYEVEAGLVRKKSGTNPTYVNTDILCTADITGISLVRPNDTANVHMNPIQVGTCISNFDLGGTLWSNWYYLLRCTVLPRKGRNRSRTVFIIVS